MFAERFNNLMNVAEVSNSLLGRNVHMNSSHIGRLRSGARPLPKKHDFLMPMCQCLANHIKKEYQLEALEKLTGIGNVALLSSETMASYLEQWLLEKDPNHSAALGRLISGFSRLNAKPAAASQHKEPNEISYKYAPYLYGNAGKRIAVEQFFRLILKEEQPQTLLLFSDENMDWLDEDPAFACQWAELFMQVLLRGNRVQIIHTISRDFNEMLEAVTKWLPVYMTGKIESYCFPQLRDGIFQRTLFIAPHTAAVVSSSTRQHTEGMLNLFITDRAAIHALVLEYQHFFSLCRPLMQIFMANDAEAFRKTARGLRATDGDVSVCCAMPPLFSMPRELAQELAEQNKNEEILKLWKKNLTEFQKLIKNQRLSLMLMDTAATQQSPKVIHPPLEECLAMDGFSYSQEQYIRHIDYLMKLSQRYENLRVHFCHDISANTLFYIKNDHGVIITKTDKPMTAFVIHNSIMASAFQNYLMRL